MAPASRERPVQLRSKKRKRNHVLHDGDDAGFVALDELSWREVPFPETFEDAEGFFGLEEVSDIDVAQKEGRIGYKLAAKKSTKAAAKREIQHLRNDAQASHEAESEKDNEWDGFDSNNCSKVEKRQDDGRARMFNALNTKLDANGERFDVLEEVDDEVGDVSAWNDLKLSTGVLASLAKLHFSRPTAIQKAAVPEIMEGHDVIGKAQTGSGKTLAFGIPILESFLARTKSFVVLDEKAGLKSHNVIALIVSPTRELAHQLSDHLNALCSIPDAPSIVTLTGGLSLHKQQRLLSNADIVIATPGRLWEVMNGNDDLMKQLRAIQFFVFDEADRLLSEGHFKDLSEIIRVLDPEYQDNNASDMRTKSSGDRQTLVFSATFQKDLQRKLSGKSKSLHSELLDQQGSMDYLLKKLTFREPRPKFIDVNPNIQMADNLTERILECAALEKDLYLYTVLLHQRKTRSIVFPNSISAVRRLVPLLQNLNVQAHALHSEMPQKARMRSIERFSSPSTPASVLVATDVAARGLDIPFVHLVIHYHVPHSADMYVHRSGRTARAERSGSSILLCSPDEVQGVRRLVAKVHVQSSASGKEHDISTIEVDRRVVDRVKPRVILSKKITDASLAKEKHSQEDNWLRNAAEELGVDYESDEFASTQGTQKGRGAGRKKREKEARGISKAEIASLRAQLKAELRTRVNIGVSERYLTAGGLDVDTLLQGQEQGDFLGKLDLAGIST